jgi:hypothetical protein
MLVWVFAFLFALVFGALGYGSGAIRMIVALIGTVISVAVMEPLGRLLEPVAAHVAADNVALREMLPGFSAFVVVWLVIYGLGFLAHQPIVLHVKYNEDDATRESFGRMNQAGGLVIGLLMALMVFLMAGKRVYAGGYLTAQTTPSDAAGEPALVKLGTALRRSMSGTPWERTFAALDRTPARFYEVSDVLGLLYENPGVIEYFRDYPAFFSLEGKQEFVDMAGDTEFMDLVKNKAGFSPVVNHPKVRALIANPDLTTALLQMDLSDFSNWVKTGVSPKYADEKILGRWRIDVASVLLSIRRQRGNIPPAEFAAMRYFLSNMLSPIRFKFCPDGKYYVTSVGGAPKPAEGAEAAAAAPETAGPAVDPSLSARYGLGGRRPRGGAAAGGAAAAAAAAPAAPKMALPKMNLNGEGQWVRNPDGKYSMTGAGIGAKVEASFNELGRIVVPVPDIKGSIILIPSN